MPTLYQANKVPLTLAALTASSPWVLPLRHHWAAAAWLLEAHMQLRESEERAALQKEKLQAAEEQLKMLLHAPKEAEGRASGGGRGRGRGRGGRRRQGRGGRAAGAAGGAVED